MRCVAALKYHLNALRRKVNAVYCLTTLRRHEGCLSIHGEEKKATNARMNWLPFNVLHNCQQNRQMPDGWAPTLSLPLRFQRERIIAMRHLSFRRFCDVFKLIPHPQQHAWVSVVQLYVSQNQAAPFPFFSAVDLGPLKYFKRLQDGHKRHRKIHLSCP